MEIKKSDNKSLIMYTSLIFVAAIIMIVVSFFAQQHLEGLRVSETEAENVTLSNKAAQVSEENMQLVELNKSLKDANKALTDANVTLTTERDTLLKEKNAYLSLMEVYEKLLGGKKTSARKILKEIYTEDLSPEQKEIYDFLVKDAQ
ncbi:MAG: hypothetical protein IKY39_00305 [Clostridia bacterium]|nr:hypothetical protein [Clostridia bacterium]